MLIINTEFRKGILFVRLSGILSDDTYKEMSIFLEEMIDQNNMKYLVFNVEELKYIDIEGINILLKYNEKLTESGGKALVCGIKNDLVKLRIDNSNMLKYMFETSDELGAINVLSM